jgi:hypothetical protein
MKLVVSYVDVRGVPPSERMSWMVEYQERATTTLPELFDDSARKVLFLPVQSDARIEVLEV